MLLTVPCLSGAEWLYAGWEGEVYPNASSSSHPLMSSVTINCENGCLFDVVAGEILLCRVLRSHFTRAQGTPKYKIGLGRGKDGRVGVGFCRSSAALPQLALSSFHVSTCPSTVLTTQWTYRGQLCSLQPLPSDPTEHVDIAKAHPDIVASMTARLQQLEPSFYSNNETGTDSPACASAPNGMPCACYLALPGNYWDGYFGPYQV